MVQAIQSNFATILEQMKTKTSPPGKNHTGIALVSCSNNAQTYLDGLVIVFYLCILLALKISGNKTYDFPFNIKGTAAFVP